MKFAEITLGQFLVLFANKNTANMQFNIINTDNKSFPEKYRRKHEVASTFWADLYRRDDPDNLLDRVIDFIALLPNGLDPYENIGPLFYGFDRGFYKQIENNDDDRIKYQILPPVIYITLKSETYTSDKSE